MSSVLALRFCVNWVTMKRFPTNTSSMSTDLCVKRELRKRCVLKIRSVHCSCFAVPENSTAIMSKNGFLPVKVVNLVGMAVSSCFPVFPTQWLLEKSNDLVQRHTVDDFDGSVVRLTNMGSSAIKMFDVKIWRFVTLKWWLLRSLVDFNFAGKSWLTCSFLDLLEINHVQRHWS